MQYFYTKTQEKQCTVAFKKCDIPETMYCVSGNSAKEKKKILISRQEIPVVPVRTPIYTRYPAHVYMNARVGMRACAYNGVLRGRIL